MASQQENCQRCFFPISSCLCNVESLQSIVDSSLDVVNKEDCQQLFNDLEDLSAYIDYVSSLDPKNIDTSSIKVFTCIGVIDELQIYLSQLKAVLRLKLPKVVLSNDALRDFSKEVFSVRGP